MTKKILHFILAATLLAGAPTTMRADAIMEVNVVDFAQVNITYANGVLHVSGANGQPISVYNIVGQRVYVGKIDSNDKRIELNLAPNYYIVKIGEVARKISVRR